MRRKKEIILSTIGAVGVGTLTFLVMNPKNKRKETKTNLPIRKAGVPEEDHTENAKMVAEGSQFGVDYYNKIKEKRSKSKIG